MDRRNFLKTTTGVAATATGIAGTAAAGSVGETPLAAPAIGKGTRRVVVALPASLDHLEPRTALNKLVARLTRTLAVPTAIDIVVTTGSGLDAIASGSADFYYGLESEHSAHHPALPIFAGLPLGHDLPPAAHHAWLTMSSGREHWAAAQRAVDAVILPVGHTGPSPGLYTDVAFDSVQDLRGAKVAARGIAADALGTLGADVSTGASDGPGAVAARGLVAAEPLLTPFESKAQWAYHPGLTPGGLMLTLGTRAGVWHALSPVDRAVIEGLAAEMVLADLGHALLRTATLEQIGHARRWPMPSAMPDALATGLTAAMTARLDRLALSDRLAAQAIDSHRQFAVSLPQGHRLPTAASV